MGRVRDNTTGLIETETREIMNYNHGKYYQDEINEEMELHEEDEGEKIETENADGNLDTASMHIHEIDENSKIAYDGQIMSVQEVAELPRFKVSPEYFAELYNEKAKAFEGKEEIDMDKVYNEIEDDVNDEMQDGQKR